MRESPALTICEGLVKRGARLRVWDPVAMEDAHWRLSSIKNSVYFASDEYDAIKSSHAVALLTEWHSFRNLDLRKTAQLLLEPFFFDLRNIRKREEIEAVGLKYFCVGQGSRA